MDSGCVYTGARQVGASIIGIGFLVSKKPELEAREVGGERRGGGGVAEGGDPERGAEGNGIFFENGGGIEGIGGEGQGGAGGKRAC